jgi:hypothetical protein
MSDKPPAHWLEPAEELRVEARRMEDRIIRIKIEMLARACERLAVYVAERQRLFDAVACRRVPEPKTDHVTDYQPPITFKNSNLRARKLGTFD